SILWTSLKRKKLMRFAALVAICVIGIVHSPEVVFAHVVAKCKTCSAIDAESVSVAHKPETVHIGNFHDGTILPPSVSERQRKAHSVIELQSPPSLFSSPESERTKFWALRIVGRERGKYDIKAIAKGRLAGESNVALGYLSIAPASISKFDLNMARSEQIVAGVSGGNFNTPNLHPRSEVYQYTAARLAGLFGNCQESENNRPSCSPVGPSEKV